MPTSVAKQFSRANSAVIEVTDDGSGDTITLNRAFFASGFVPLPSGLIEAFTVKPSAAAAAAILQNLEWSCVQDFGAAAAVPVFVQTAAANTPAVAITFPAAAGRQWRIKIKIPPSLTL